MTYSTSQNNDYNFDFLSDLPVPNESDSEWLDNLEEELSCQECEYYNDNGIFPCAVNPSQVYHANDCNDYLISSD